MMYFILTLLLCISTNVYPNQQKRKIIKIDVSQYQTHKIDIEQFALYNDYLIYQNDVNTIYSINLPESIVNYYDIDQNNYGHLVKGHGRGPEEVSFLNMISFNKDYVYVSDSEQKKYLIYDKRTKEFKGEVKTKNFNPNISIVDSLVVIPSFMGGTSLKLFDSDLNYIKDLNLPVDPKKGDLFKFEGQVVRMQGSYYYFFIHFGFFREFDSSTDIPFPFISDTYDTFDEIRKPIDFQKEGRYYNPYTSFSKVLYHKNGYLGIQYFNPETEVYMFDLFKESGEYLGSVDYQDTFIQFQKKYGSVVDGGKRLYNEFHLLLNDQSGQYIIIDMVKAILEAQ